MGQSGSGKGGSKGFGRIGAEGKGSLVKGSRDEEMGIPLKESGAVVMREVSTSGS